MASLITLYNQALAQIAAGEIAEIDEASIEARECSRFGPPLLDEIADWEDFEWGRERVLLAEVTNDRPAEWKHAYAAPADMAAPIAIRKVQPDAHHLPIAGDYPFPYQDALPLAFLFEGGKIYCNVEKATLIYQRSRVTAADLGGLMSRAFVLELAARICLPIKKDAALASRIMQMAVVAKDAALVAEFNRKQQHAIPYVSAAEQARAGMDV
ncbi:hypothetical protein [Novosphingobium rosa]|uniref:hypothetical protein n=1 Tax=Novosphingobium rosa TaxID=76978 RepID=UPI00082C697D|nr:hypothetical protein [Novosphingobium rosa]